MHPVTAILGLLVLTASLAWGRWSLLLVVGIVVVSLYVSTGGHRLLDGFWHRLRRLRWLFLTIIIIYGWLTPGFPVWAGLGSFSPTENGLLHGSLRCLNLVFIVAAVHWLLAQLDRESLVSGLYWLARPLTSLGLRPEILAVRLVLTLEYLDRVQASRPSVRSADGRRVLDRLADWFGSVLETGAQRPSTVIDLALVEAPRARDWLVLLGFVGVLLAAGTGLSL